MVATTVYLFTTLAEGPSAPVAATLDLFEYNLGCEGFYVHLGTYEMYFNISTKTNLFLPLAAIVSPGPTWTLQQYWYLCWGLGITVVQVMVNPFVFMPILVQPPISHPSISVQQRPGLDVGQNHWYECSSRPFIFAFTIPWAGTEKQSASGAAYHPNPRPYFILPNKLSSPSMMVPSPPILSLFFLKSCLQSILKKRNQRLMVRVNRDRSS